MNLRVEVGRFFTTAAAVAVSSILPLAILWLISGDQLIGPLLFLVVLVAFVIAVVAGIFIGLPVLHLARRLGWTDQLWKLSIVGSLSGTAVVAGVIWLTSGGVPHTLVWSEVFPAYALFGGVGGLTAAIVWHLLHRNDGTPSDA